MTRKYVADQNQTAYIYESGTFANTSGAAQWFGEVQSCDPTEELNIEQIRYQGSGNRNVDGFEATIKDYSIGINKFAQDWRNLYFALGSVSTSGAGPYTHTISEINNDDENGVVTGVLLPSITIENAKSIGVAGSNAIRTFKGCCLNELSISSDGTGLITVDETWLGASLVPSSGAPSTVTAQTTSRWKACQFSLDIPSGTQVDEMKGWDLTINNNLEPDHYSNGSCNAASFTALDREYEFSPVIDSNYDWWKTLYESYFLGGSEFNAQLKGIAETGSREVYITMSGCRVTDMDQPTPNSGKNEDTPTITPKSISVQVIDSVPLYKLF